MRLRRSLARLVAASCLPLSLATVAAAQEPVNMMHGYFLGRQALAAGDTAAALRHLLAAERFVPASPYAVVRLVPLLLAGGDSAGARQRVERLLAAGMESVVRGRPQLSALVPLPPPPAAPRLDTLLLLPDPEMIPEGVAVDERTGALYVGGLASGAVLRVQDGRTTTLVEGGRAEVGEVLGLRVDPARGTLWAASRVRDPAAPPASDGVRGWAQLLRFDLASGRLLRSWRLGDAQGPHLLNDIAVHPSGTLYLSDSEGGRVYRLDPDADSLRLFHQGGPGFSYPNGIALSAGGDTLYVAHGDGIAAWDLRGGAKWEAGASPAAWTGLIDGLYRCGADLVGIQSLGDLQRVVRVRLDRGRVRSATTEHLLPAPAGISTTAAVAAGHLVVLGNTGLERLRPEGPTPSNGARATLLRFPLECR